MTKLEEMIQSHDVSEVNLHIHTNRSSGSYIPYLVSRAAHNQGMGLIAYTDHNRLPSEHDYGMHEVDPLFQQVKLIPALEWSASYPGIGVVHLLSYFTGPEENIFCFKNRSKYEEIEKDFLGAVRQKHKTEVIQTVTNFNRHISDVHGAIPEDKEALSLEEVFLAEARRRNALFWGRSVLDEPDPASIDIAELLIRKGYFKTRLDAWNYFKQHNLIPKSDDSRYPHTYDVLRAAEYLGATDIVIAHPKTCMKHGLEKFTDMVEDLTAFGLTGLEVICPTSDQRTRWLLEKLTNKYDLTKTIGGDNHTAEEIANLRVI